MSDLFDSGIFPDQIISEILTRLPAKSICRFKSVSKGWYSMICNPHFMSSYISKSSLSWAIFDRFIPFNPKLAASEFTLQWQKPPNVSIFSVNPHKIVDKSTEIVIEGDEFPATLLASSNGFILFSIKIERDPFKEKTATYFSWISEEDSLFVVSPITREWVSIPKPPHFINNQSSVGFITQVNLSGVLERFIIAEYQPIIGSKTASIMCFSSETCKWEQISANYMLVMHMWSGDGTVEFDGHLVWVDPRLGIIVWDEPFSGQNEVHCRFIAFPRESRGSEGDDRLVDVGGGHIQFIELSKKKKKELSLWRLQDYEGGEWSLVHKLSLKDVWSDESYLAYGLEKVVPNPYLGYLMHPFEADIAYFMVGDRLFSLNFGTKKVESCSSGYSGLSKYIYFIIVKLPSFPLSFSPSLKATFLKEQGNKYFKAKNFNEAINYYTRSIALADNVLAYANRGMANIKVHRYHEAEADCTEALKLDGEYFKAYGRRAVARKELGDLTGYVEDLEFALKLKPNDQEMKKLYAEVKTLIDKVKTTATAPVPTDPPAQNDSSTAQENGSESVFVHEGSTEDV
ncbi:putative F-box/kelch-repeat protein At1g15680 [Chenopodium quinoa]|uniref:putative F-box/kelch-repeat protein At1g15680 n=1 Tax=Chenopodium quinoa TaxID=63459 RepID=UPI000B77CFD7|nr:putative F-box/kelch-repeat protein At1g15680 [Chenopodium quinoa]